MQQVVIKIKNSYSNLIKQKMVTLQGIVDRVTMSDQSARVLQINTPATSTFCYIYLLVRLENSVLKLTPYDGYSSWRLLLEIQGSFVVNTVM